jgi:hypothetical protein
MYFILFFEPIIVKFWELYIMGGAMGALGLGLESTLNFYVQQKN